MNKILLMLSLMVMGLFLIGCGTTDNSDLPKEMQAPSSSVAGQAYYNALTLDQLKAGVKLDSGYNILVLSSSVGNLPAAEVVFRGVESNLLYVYTNNPNTMYIPSTSSYKSLIPAWNKPGKWIDQLKPGVQYWVRMSNSTLLEYPSIQKNIQLKYSGYNRYELFWYDGNNNKVDMPLAYLNGPNYISLAEDSTKLLVLKETTPIKKNDYFVVGNGSKSYLLQYKGTDATGTPDQKIKFKDVGSGDALTYSIGTSPTIATLKIGGNDYLIKNVSSTAQADFNISVDLWGDGIIGNNIYPVNIRDNGIVFGIEQNDPSKILLSLRSTGTTVKVGITPEDGKIKATFEGGCQLIYQGVNISSCVLSPTETFKWNSSQPEGFVYTH